MSLNYQSLSDLDGHGGIIMGYGGEDSEMSAKIYEVVFSDENVLELTCPEDPQDYVAPDLPERRDAGICLSWGREAPGLP